MLDYFNLRFPAMESRDENEPQPGPSTSADGASGGGEPRTLSEYLALPENKG